MTDLTLNPGDLSNFAESLKALTGTTPVAVTFCQQPPPGVPHIDRPAAAGCGYWKEALSGRIFYTEASDHYGCAIGAYTHGAALPPAQQQDLKGLLGTMIGLSYLKESEVPQIPHLQGPLHHVVYAPLDESPVMPDVVIVRGRPKALMLLSEACRLAGYGDGGPVMGRPACSMLPLAHATVKAVTSLGCIGNRVYTALGDDEEYLALPGSVLAAIMIELKKIVHANQVLREHHEAKLLAASQR